MNIFIWKELLKAMKDFSVSDSAHVRIEKLMM